MYTTLISAQQLQTLLKSGQPVMVFDCSFELMTPGAGDQQYQQTHIAGAVRADLERHLSAKSPVQTQPVEATVNPSTDSGRMNIAASGGRHPLPAREAFAAWLSRVGFANTMQAVVYDRQGVNYCGRLWWLLKWVGHEAVAVLDGGLQAWQAKGGATQSGLGAPALPTEFVLTEARTELTSTETVANQLGRPTQTLIDARCAARFCGEVEPLDPVAGHIPGALNRPFNLNLDAQGQFKSATQLRSEFETLLAGRDPATVVHHCGSGVSAVPNLIAMEVAGLGRSALYAGSWSEWCSDPARPMVRG